jgi:ABC-2 type transport system ATP-binding protein
MLHEPELLLLDEPTAGVDPKARRDFWAQIHRLAGEGLTVLVSTHYMDEAERCHQLAYISYGRLLASGSAADVLTQAGLRTWALHGAAVDAVRKALERDGQWMCAPFGNVLHVSAAQTADLSDWLGREMPGHGCTVEPIATGLEDVFIALTDRAQDNFS